MATVASSILYLNFNAFDIVIYPAANKKLVNQFLNSSETDTLDPCVETADLSKFGPGPNFGSAEFTKKINNPFLQSTDPIRIQKPIANSVLGASDTAGGEGSGSSPGTQYWG